MISQPYLAAKRASLDCPESIDSDIRQVLDICKGDYKAALRMVLVANAYYEEEIERLKNEASSGFGRGQVRKPAKRSN